MRIISACLLGINCRYDGENNRNEKVLKLIQDSEESFISACPEQLGGLQTPRNPSILSADGEEILDGNGKVIMQGWGNVTSKFLKGAEETLKLSKLFGANKAILKSKSPSCGVKKIPMDFQEKKKGMGVTAALLQRNGIEIISEKDL